MEIKELSSENIPQIMQLEKDNSSEWIMYDGPDKVELTFIMQNAHCNAYGIFDNNLLVGWGGYQTMFNKANSAEGVFEINSVLIAKSHRGKGLGELLLKKVISELKKNEKYKKIFLTVSPLNTSALIFYLKNGFVIYDYKKDYYGKGSDRIFLSLIES